MISRRSDGSAEKIKGKDQSTPAICHSRITNNLYGAGSRDRSFSYDALGRLIQVIGGPYVLPSWIQTYTYDR